MNPFSHTGLSISDSLKSVRKSVLIYETIILATFEATKKWTQTIRNWGSVYGELCIMYEGRLPE